MFFFMPEDLLLKKKIKWNAKLFLSIVFAAYIIAGSDGKVAPKREEKNVVRRKGERFTWKRDELVVNSINTHDTFPRCS